MITALAAVGVTASILTLLALHDPKRVRTVARAVGSRGRTFGKPVRIALGSASIAPGVVLALYNEWPAFLIWIGISCGIGWVLTIVLAPPPRRDRASRAARSLTQHPEP